MRQKSERLFYKMKGNERIADTVFYDILGVSPNATPQQIKRSFQVDRQYAQAEYDHCPYGGGTPHCHFTVHQ